jgi:hypothetical protein
MPITAIGIEASPPECAIDELPTGSFRTVSSMRITRCAQVTGALARASNTAKTNKPLTRLAPRRKPLYTLALSMPLEGQKRTTYAIANLLGGTVLGTAARED